MREEAFGRRGTHHGAGRRVMQVVAQLLAASVMVGVYLVVVTSGRVIP